jgi:hypothetical protein
MRRVSGLAIAGVLAVVVWRITRAADGEQPKAATPASAPDRATAPDEQGDSLWSYRAALMKNGEAVVAKARKNKDGSLSASNSNRPFTYEEQASDKPSR